MNNKGLLWAGVFALLQAFPVTYFAQNPPPATWPEFFKPGFVMALIAVFTGNALFAHLSFRDPNLRTRISDSSIDSPKSIRDLLDRRK